MPIVLKLGMVCTSSSKCRRVPHNSNAKMCWATRYRWDSKWKDEVRWRWLEVRAEHLETKLPLTRPQITFTVYAISQMDSDNLRTACKPLLDALKVDRGIGLIVDDSPDHIPEPVYRQVKVKKRLEEHVEIQI